MRISDWSAYVGSSDLRCVEILFGEQAAGIVTQAGGADRMVAVIEDRHHDIGKAADHRAVFVEEDGAHHLLDGDAALDVLRHDNKLHIRLRAADAWIVRTGSGLQEADWPLTAGL